MNFFQYLNFFFSKKEKVNFIFLIFISIINAIFELLAITTVLSFLAYLVDEKNFINNQISKSQILNNFNLSNDEITYFLIFIIITAIIFRFFINFFFIYYSNYFTISVQNNISKKIFRNYIFQNVDFFSNNSKSILTRNILNSKSFASVLGSVINLIAECLVTLCLVLFLFYVNYKITTISVIFILTVIFYIVKRNKKKVFLLGKELQLYSAFEIELVRILIDGFLEINAFLKQNFFVNKFFENLKKQQSFLINLGIRQQLPRLLSETIILISLISIIYFLFLYDKKNFLVTVSAFGLVFARILPAFNRISINYLKLKGNQALFDILKKECEIKVEEISNKKFLLPKNKIIFDHFTFYYQRENFIFENSNFEIERGKILGIKGKSGTGKSTFVNLLMGNLKLIKGRIFIDGKEVSNIDLKNIGFGYVPQKPFMFSDNSIENIILKSELNDAEYDNLVKVAEIAILEDFVSFKDKQLLFSENNFVGNFASKLSGGQLQRLAIARALFLNDNFLILDEATNALDKGSEENIIRNLKKINSNKFVILISHEDSVIENCDLKYEIKDRKIIRL